MDPTRSQAFKNCARFRQVISIENIIYSHHSVRFQLVSVWTILTFENPFCCVHLCFSWPLWRFAHRCREKSCRRKNSRRETPGKERECFCTHSTERVGHPGKTKTSKPEDLQREMRQIRTTKIPVQVATAWRLRPALAVPSRLPELLRQFLQQFRDGRNDHLRLHLEGPMKYPTISGHCIQLEECQPQISQMNYDYEVARWPKNLTL